VSRRAAIPVLAATIITFVGLAVAVGVTVSAPPDLLERKVAAAERHLYYRITHTTGPVFELEGTERTLRLIVHAYVPGGGYDPAREVELGARVELLDATGWRRDIYARARQSKARPIEAAGETLWLDENAFSLHRGIELTDDRQLVVPLPANVSPGTKVRVTLLGDVRDGIVRAYTPVPRKDVERRVDALRGIDRDHIAAQLGVEPWDQLTAASGLASLRLAEHRLSAEGEEGEDYEIREVYTTGFRIRDDRVQDSGMLVGPEYTAAVNVLGPAVIDLTVRRVDSATTGGTLTATLAGPRVIDPGRPESGPAGSGAALPPSLLALPDGGLTAQRAISIPEGAYTLAIAASEPARVELAAPTATVALGGHAALVPDVQRVTAYATAAQGEPIRVALAGPDDQLGRAIRIDVRPLAAREVTLIVDGVDARKQATTALTTRVESELSRFEVALVGDQQLRVAEPVPVRFIAAPGTRELRVRTDGAALVTFATPFANTASDVLEPAYAAVPLTTQLWRYARFSDRSWMTVRPSNQDMLGTERAVTVLAQARLEPREIVPPTENVGTSLSPTERLERRTIIERLTGDAVADALARWSAGHHTRVVPGKPLTVDFSRAPDRVSLAYYATDGDADVVGETATVKLDGKPLPAVVFGSTSGSIDLPRDLTGARTIEVESAAPVRWFIDRPPVNGGAELYAFRTVYRVPDDGQRIRIKVTKRDTAPQNVNLVLYTPTASDAETKLRVTVDGGTPERIEAKTLAKWTIADRTVPLPVSDKPATLGFTDVARGGPLRPHLLAIALGDDLRPGTHTVELRVTGARPVWGRFFVLDGGTKHARAVQWRDWSDP
jgi:hypothetical protein